LLKKEGARDSWTE